VAKRRSLSADPMIRHAVRSGVRAGLSAAQILADVTSRFPRVTEGTVTRMTQQEVGRQRAVDRVMGRDFRFRTSLHGIVGCGKGEKVRGAITIQWFDEQIGRIRTYGASATFKSTGTLGDILNDAIAQVVSGAVGNGYLAPEIRSSMRTGTTSYRIDYLECY
jgi:hypothetical protein